LTQKVVLN